jgi:gliding motility-associated-like protein
MTRTIGLSILASLILIAFSPVAQGQLWSTDFEGTNVNVALNNGALTGAAGAGDNLWVINSAYAGGTAGPLTVPPTPAQPAAIIPNSQNYLHITSTLGQSQTPPIENAHFNPAAPVGESYFTEIQTGISTMGQTGIELNFWMLNGSSANEAEVYVKDGPTGTWTQLNNGDFTQSLASQNNWIFTTYTGNALNNLNDVYIGFRFISDPGGSQPSFALDNISITQPASVQAVVDSPNPLPTSLCQGDQVTFDAQTDPSIGAYQWNFNGANTGPQSLNGSTVNFTAGTPGNYTFELIVTDGVSQDNFTWNVTVNPCNPPNIMINANPTTVCEGANVTFQNNTQPGSEPITGIQWTFPGGNPGTSSSNNPLVSYATPGFYDVILEVTDANGTTADTFVNYIEVIACPPPVADFDASARKICPGDCISFVDQSTNMSGAGSTWNWSFPGSDSATSTTQNPQNICYQTPGLYTVTLEASNINGTDSKSIAGFIEVDSCLAPEARFSVEADSICVGNCIQFRSTSRREDSLTWTFFGADAPYQNSIEQNPIVCYSDTGTYNVQIRADNEYGTDVALETQRISVKNYPEVVASPDQEVLIGRSVRLEAFGTANNFMWTPDYEIDCTDCRQVRVTPKENTIYYVTNTNSNGCSSTDSIRVLVRKEYYAGVPDAFSPNGDGQNDELRVRGNGITDMQFYVYNRYGELVFESYTQDRGWDGTFRGTKLDPGVFAYMVRLTYINGYQEILKGDVTLVR